MQIHQELYMRLKAFIQSVANVCPSCVRRSDAMCSVCCCQPAKRLLGELDLEAGAVKVEVQQKKKRPKNEIAVLRFIRDHEKKGTQFSFCINRIRIAGIESWQKHCALNQLVADGLVEVVHADAKAPTLKHAQTVEARREEIDKELSNV